MSGPHLRDLDGHDPYALLGVESNATRAQIVAAHRKQVQLVHPDRPGGSEYETKLLHIAKDVLLDTRRRAEFDASRGRPADPSRDTPTRDDDGPGSEWDRAEPTSEWDRAQPASEWDRAEAESEPDRGLWESEEVTTGVGEPAWEEPRTTTHWPPPPQYQPPDYPQYDYPPHEYPQPHHQQPYYPPPQYQPPYWQARPARAVSALPIVALVLSTVCACATLGLVLGLISLSNPKGRRDRLVAGIAVVIGGFATLVLVLAYLSRSVTGS